MSCTTQQKESLLNENVAREALGVSDVGSPRISQADHQTDERTHRW